MFNFSQLNQIQIEITNRCQASCPMCLRNIHGGIDNDLLSLNDWTIEGFKEVFNSTVLNQINKLHFCGDFGDPIMNNDLISMCQYIKTNKPSLYVSITTNGSARSVSWWKDLANSLPNNHKVEFGIDGLSDTHSIHRIGTNFTKIIDNAKAFISSGGKAEWMFIRFKHNEHQINEAHDLATNLGFASFTIKNSKRFEKPFPVLNKEGNISHYIEQPTLSPIKFFSKEDYKSYKSWSDIECFALNVKEVYIDCHYTVIPCCLMGSFLYTKYDSSVFLKYGLIEQLDMISTGAEIQTQVYGIVNELGGLNKLNAKMHGIKNILETDTWQTLMQRKWKNKESYACMMLCSKDSPMIPVKKQLDTRTEFKND